LLKTTEIFPHDLDVDKDEGLNHVLRKDKYLRPEFVCSYERPLKADAGKDLGFLMAKDTKSKVDEVSLFFIVVKQMIYYRMIKWN
jgi:hypothetical protein